MVRIYTKNAVKYVQQEYPGLDFHEGTVLYDSINRDVVKVTGISEDSVIVRTLDGQEVHIGRPTDVTMKNFLPAQEAVSEGFVPREQLEELRCD